MMEGITAERPLRVTLQAASAAALQDCILNVRAKCIAQGIEVSEIRIHPSGTKCAVILRVPEKHIQEFKSRPPQANFKKSSIITGNASSVLGGGYGVSSASSIGIGGGGGGGSSSHHHNGNISRKPEYAPFPLPPALAPPTNNASNNNNSNSYRRRFIGGNGGNGGIPAPLSVDIRDEDSQQQPKKNKKKKNKNGKDQDKLEPLPEYLSTSAAQLMITEGGARGFVWSNSPRKKAVVSSKHLSANLNTIRGELAKICRLLAKLRAGPLADEIFGALRAVSAMSQKLAMQIQHSSARVFDNLDGAGVEGIRRCLVWLPAAIESLTRGCTDSAVQMLGNEEAHRISQSLLMSSGGEGEIEFQAGDGELKMLRKQIKRRREQEEQQDLAENSRGFVRSEEGLTSRYKGRLSGMEDNGNNNNKNDGDYEDDFEGEDDNSTNNNNRRGSFGGAAAAAAASRKEKHQKSETSKKKSHFVSTDDDDDEIDNISVEDDDVPDHFAPSSSPPMLGHSQTPTMMGAFRKKKKKNLPSTRMSLPALNM